MAELTQDTLDGAPTTATCDQCSRTVPVYRYDEPGRRPFGPSRTGWHLVEHDGRPGGRYTGTTTCVMSDREPGGLQDLPRERWAR